VKKPAEAYVGASYARLVEIIVALRARAPLPPETRAEIADILVRLAPQAADFPAMDVPPRKRGRPVDWEGWLQAEVAARVAQQHDVALERAVEATLEYFGRRDGHEGVLSKVKGISGGEVAPFSGVPLDSHVALAAQNLIQARGQGKK
jgi:hypothetical protein